MFGQRLRLARRKAGLSMRELAVRLSPARVGSSDQQVRGRQDDAEFGRAGRFGEDARRLPGTS